MFLPCDRTGRGRLSKPLDQDQNRLHLYNGNGTLFPDISNGQHFYVRVSGCNSCCEVMKVIGKDGDILTVDRSFGTQCSCIHSNAEVVYTLDNAYAYHDLRSYIPINVTEPLMWNCETNTISVDCSKLFSNACGCNDENVVPPSSDGAQPGVAAGTGLRGERGEQGPQGIGIGTATVSATGRLLITRTDGKIIDAGALPVAKGVPGPAGERGPAGDQGPQGEDGTSVTSARQESDNLIISMSDGAEHNVGNVKGPKGDKGEKGDAGPKGDAGRDGINQYPQYVRVGDRGRIFGPSSAELKIVYITKSDAAAGKKTGATVSVQLDSLGTAVFPAIPQDNFLEFYVGSRLIGIGES